MPIPIPSQLGHRPATPRPRPLAAALLGLFLLTALLGIPACDSRTRFPGIAPIVAKTRPITDTSVPTETSTVTPSPTATNTPTETPTLTPVGFKPTRAFITTTPLPRGTLIYSGTAPVLLPLPQSTAGPELTVWAADNDMTITLHPHQVLAIYLDSDPTSGFHWDSQSPNNRSLTFLSSAFVILPGGSKPISGKAEIWKFVGAAPGASKLILRYQRQPDAKNPRLDIAGEFDLNVWVR